MVEGSVKHARHLAAAALSCALLVCIRRTPARAAEVPRARPRLVLALSVDQMRFDYLTRFAPLFQGGLKTVGEKGAVFTNAGPEDIAPTLGALLGLEYPSADGRTLSELLP
jgi:hypothetical protein